MQEIFVDVPGYDGFYKASNLGYILSVQREQKCKLGTFSTRPQRILKPYITKGKKGGYYRLALSKNNKLKSFLLSRLICAAFHPNPLNLPEVNHKDGNKLNNRADNLEWNTRPQNMKHRIHILGQTPPTRQKLVMDLQTGIFYCSAKEAYTVKPVSFKLDHFHNMLRGAAKNKTTFVYC